MRMWVIDNWAIKIGALFIALVLWFHAVTEKEFEVRQQVPIQITSVPKELILAKPIPVEATIRLRGKGKQLIIPFFSNITLAVRVTGAKKGTMLLSLSPENVDISHTGGVSLVEIVSPSQLSLEFDSLLKKMVPVRSQIHIVPMPGFVQVGSTEFSPDSILVQGPARYVEAIESILTDSMSYTGVRKSVSDVVGLVDPEGFNVTYLPQTIEAASSVQRLVQRTIDDIPVTLTHTPDGTAFRLEPSVISLTISGGEEYLSELTKEDFSAFADYRRAIRRPDQMINARINLPPEVQLNSAEPQTFKVITEG